MFPLLILSLQAKDSLTQKITNLPCITQTRCSGFALQSHFPSFEQCLDINVTLVSLEMQWPLCFTLCANRDEIEARAGIPGCSAHTHTLQGLTSVTQLSLWQEESELPVGWLVG